jgi:hypothetical protein
MNRILTMVKQTIDAGLRVGLYRFYRLSELYCENVRVNRTNELRGSIMAGNVSTNVPVRNPARAATRATVTAVPSALRRISWGAVIAGVVVATVVHLALSLLGVSVGAATIRPLEEAYPAAGLGTGAVIWMAASTLLALFAGGWVAAWLAGIPRHEDGVLHGIVTWALASLVAFMLLTTAVGNVINSAASALGAGLAVLGQGAANAAPEVASALERRDISLSSIQEEARTLLQGGAASSTTGAVPAGTTGTTGTTAGQNAPGAVATMDAPLSVTTVPGNGAAAPAATTVPGGTGASSGTTADQATSGAVMSALAGSNVPASTGNANSANLSAADRETNFLLTQFLRPGSTDADRSNLINLLVNRGGMSADQAQQTVDRWSQSYQQLAAEADRVAREAADAARKAVAAAAGLAFMALVVGAFAAGAGGYVGAPHDLDSVVETERVSVPPAQ